jgi:hypothetical protein
MTAIATDTKRLPSDALDAAAATGELPRGHEHEHEHERAWMSGPVDPIPW